VRRRDELERAVRTANREADGISERWQALRHALQQEARAVQPLLAERHELAEVDGQALHALVTHTLALSSDDPPPAELASLVEATILVLDKGLRAAQEELFTLERQTNRRCSIRPSNQAAVGSRASDSTSSATPRTMLNTTPRRAERLTPRYKN